MSLGQMRQELLGIPGTNFGLVTTKINEALTKIQDEQTWSFQLLDGGWFTPGLLGGANVSFLSPGTISVNPFSTTITGDAVATATWTAPIPYPPLLTQQQIRVPYYSLYNIIALGNNGKVSYSTIITAGSTQTPGIYTVPVTDGIGDGSGGSISITVNSDGTVTEQPIVLATGQNYIAPAVALTAGGTPATFTVSLQATLTIDRPWMEPPQNNGGYMIYQAYFPAPPGFKRFFNIRDTTNNNAIDWWSYTQVDLADKDAQRTIFDQPLYAVAYRQDQRPGSATFGQMLYELWPHPIQTLPYTFGCMCNVAPLVNPNDAVPFPLTDELVKWRSYEVLYLWKESQKGDEMERGSGANWQFLIGVAKAEYKERLKDIKNVDRNLVELYFQKMQRYPYTQGEPFATAVGQLNVGSF